MADHIKLADLQKALFRAADLHSIGAAGIFDHAADLRRAAMRLQSLNEQACNGVMRWDEKARRVLPQWNESDQARNDKATEKAREKARAAMVGIFGANWAEFYDLEFQCDPRGAPIKIHDKGGARGWSPLVAVY